jgi:hypothetical protein
MPHSRKASNSSLTNRGGSLPVLASVWVWAMKLAALWIDVWLLWKNAQMIWYNQ